MQPYEEQLARTRRWYERFKKINSPSSNARETLDDIDDIHAFFINCYHVKDYLKSDPAFLKRPTTDIEPFITATPALTLCADICNGIKHLMLKKPRSGDTPKFAGKVHEISIRQGKDPETTPALKLNIEHDGKTNDAFQKEEWWTLQFSM